MQTFLPYSDFAKSAASLDDKRLKNQRNEALVILRSLLGEYESGGWQGHPVVEMWRGYEYSLCLYAIAICTELKQRGIKTNHSNGTPFREAMDSLKDTGFPSWLGKEDIHRSHRQALLFKRPDFYKRFGWEGQPVGPDTSGKWNYIYP